MVHGEYSNVIKLFANLRKLRAEGALKLVAEVHILQNCNNSKTAQNQLLEAYYHAGTRKKNYGFLCLP